MLDVPEVGYYDARDQIRSGDILLASGNVIFSRLIKFATKSMWSHVAFIKKIYMDEVDKNGDRKYRFFVFESVENRGVRAVPLSCYAYDYEGTKKGYNGRLMIARHEDFDISRLGLLSKKAIDMLGYPYDSIEIAKIAGRLLARRFGIGSIIERKDNGVDICSEYVERCFYPMDVFFKRKDKSFITPDDIYHTPAVKPVCWIKSVR